MNHHSNAITKLNLLINSIVERNLPDDFGVLDSLKVLQNQITSRISQLQKLSTSNISQAPNHVRNNSLPSISIQSTIGNASLQMLNATIADIQNSLVKNVNVTDSKVSLINKEKINHLEHELQLLNFKNSTDLKLKNELLTKLNMLYYSEIVAFQESSTEILNTIKNINLTMSNDDNDNNKDHDNNHWISINQPNDESTHKVIHGLQMKISALERDKLHMENEIVKLKERWNDLMENSSKRN